MLLMQKRKPNKSGISVLWGDRADLSCTFRRPSIEAAGRGTTGPLHAGALSSPGGQGTLLHAAYLSLLGVQTLLPLQQILRMATPAHQLLLALGEEPAGREGAGVGAGDREQLEKNQRQAAGEGERRVGLRTTLGGRAGRAVPHCTHLLRRGRPRPQQEGQRGH